MTSEIDPLDRPNTAPSPDGFCIDTESPTVFPVIRFIGGAELQPQFDPTRGPPTSCEMSLSLANSIQSALAPFQPFLTLLDLVATLVQVFLLAVEAITNPFKIAKMLAQIPALADKFNKLLALIPVLPQGIAAFATTVLDVLRFAATSIDCVIQTLESIRRQQEEIARLTTKANAVNDPTIAQELRNRVACSEQEVQKLTASALGSLAPIARILCTVRALLSLIPGGQAIASQLVFPDARNFTSIADGIQQLTVLRDVLLGAIDIVGALAVGINLEPDPLNFSCPLDGSEPDPDEPELPTPSISQLLPMYGLPPIIFPSSGSSEFEFQIIGSDFDISRKENKVFFGTAPLAPEQILQLHSNRILVRLNSEQLSEAGEFWLSVSNAPGAGTTKPFEGVGTDESRTKISNLVTFEVT